MRAWVLERFGVYTLVCLLAAVFLAPVSMNFSALEPFALVKLTFIWFFGVLAFGLLLAWSAERRIWLPRFRLGYAAGAFLAVSTLATVFSQNPRLSLLGQYQRYGGLAPRLLYGAVMVTIVGVCWERPERVRWLAWAALAGSVPLVGYLLIQAAGLDWVRWTDASTGGLPDYPAGTLGNSNFAGGYLAIVLPLFVYATVATRQPILKRAMIVVSCLAVVTLWFTQTRGGMMGAAAGLGTMAFLYRHRLPRWARAAGLAGVGAMVVVSVLVIWHPGTARPPGPLARLAPLRSNTIKYRGYYWTAAARMVHDRPLLGMGLDTYYENYSRYRVAADGRRNGLTVADSPHNIFVEHAAGAGILGLTTYLCLVGLAVRYGMARCRQLEGKARLLLVSFLGALVAYLVQGFFSIDVPPLALMGWVTLGCVAALADPEVVAGRSSHTRASRAFADLPREIEEIGAVPDGLPTPRQPAARLRWAVHFGVAAAVIGLVTVGTRPLRADVKARVGRITEAVHLNPLEPAYPARGSEVALRLAQAAQDPADKARWLGKAEDYTEEALRLRPDHLNYQLDMARISTLWGDSLDPARFAEANRWWERVIANDPTSLALRHRYAVALGLQRQKASQLEASALARPDYAPGWVTLARAYFGIARPGKARAALERALALGPASPEARDLSSRLR